MTAAAIAGNYAEFKLVKTRGVFAITIEFPVERTADVFAALGYPQPGTESPVAVARLNPMTESEVMPDTQPAGPHNTPPSSQTLGAGARRDDGCHFKDCSGPLKCIYCPEAGAQGSSAAKEAAARTSATDPVAPEGDENRGAYTGAAGGHARAAALSPDRRSEIAKQAAEARWGSASPGERAVKRAGILCKEEQFQNWLLAGRWILAGNEEREAAAALRTRCQIASRRDLAHDERARERFKALVTEYDLWRGRIPEVRG